MYFLFSNLVSMYAFSFAILPLQRHANSLFAGGQGNGNFWVGVFFGGVGEATRKTCRWHICGCFLTAMPYSLIICFYMTGDV